MRILGNGEQLALGTIVDPSGLVLTKASELSGDVECQLFDGRRVPAQYVGIDHDHDLAMLRLDVSDLPVASWSEQVPEVGTILATTNVEETPRSIGVVSVAPRQIHRHPGVLGVELIDAESGAGISQVLENSPAEHAGLKGGDIITQVNEKTIASREDLVNTIRSFEPGDKVRLQVMRGDQRLDLTATLGRSFSTEQANRIEFQEGLGGDLSDRRAGFPLAFQHDTVLAPQDCGGPVVNLNGEVVGINIARASRVASYALPVSVIHELLPKLKSGELAPGPSVEQRQELLTQRMKEINEQILELTKQIAVYQVAIDESTAAEQKARQTLASTTDDKAAQDELERAIAEKASVEALIAELERKLGEARDELNQAEIDKVQLENES